MGLETAFPVLYTKLVEPGIVPLETVLDRLCVRPRQIFRLPGGAIEAGAPADLTVLDLHHPLAHRQRRLPLPGPGHPLCRLAGLSAGREP